MLIFRSTFPFAGNFPGFFPVTLFLFLHLITPASADGTISITAFTSYKVQRICVKDCLWDGQPGGYPNLPNYLSCAAPYSDSCMCRTDLAATASGFLSSCVSHLCSSNTVDVSSALGLYNDYCASKLAVVTSAALASLGSFSAYSTARQCVQDCLWAGLPGGGAALPVYLQCGDIFNPPYNACMCRADLSVTVSSFLTSCANNICSGNIADINTAVSIYTAYCNAALATTTAEAAKSSSSQTVSPGQTTTPATSTTPMTVSTSSSNPTSTTLAQPNPSTSAMNTTSGGGNSLSGGAVGGIAVGSITAFALVGLGGFCCFWRGRREQNRQEIAAANRNEDGRSEAGRTNNTADTSWMRTYINGWRQKTHHAQPIQVGDPEMEAPEDSE